MESIGSITATNAQMGMVPLPEGQAGAVADAPAAIVPEGGGQDIRVRVRLDDSINRMVFEYRERDTDRLVRQLPAKEVIRFYQMMASRDEAAEGVEASEGADRDDAGSPVAAGGSDSGFDGFDSEIPQQSPTTPAVLGGGRGFETAGVVNAYA